MVEQDHLKRGHHLSGAAAPAACFEPINWHRTALHEIGHASDAAHRLNRNLSGAFGSKLYSTEEITAELISAFCCASPGIVPTVRHADYIGAWLDVLRAALQASKAADWILSFLPDDAAAPASVDGSDIRRAA